MLFNAYAPELWRRFTITLRRTLARLAGLTGKALAAQVRVSYAKVAEYQRRGVVHFHAIIRLDGPAGPTDTPPSWVAVALLTNAIDQAARAVSITTPAALGLRPAYWPGGARSTSDRYRRLRVLHRLGRADPPRHGVIAHDHAHQRSQ